MNNDSQTLTDETLRNGTGEQPQWYAVQTFARHEKKVEAELQENGINTYLPLLTQVHRWSDRHKVVHIPLFSCYTFLHSVLDPQVRSAVLRIRGVLGFVGQRNQALPIPDRQIDNIRTLLASGVAFQPYPHLKAGQRVRIRGGVLDGIEGILVTNGTKHLVIAVENVPYSLSISIEGHDVEPIESRVHSCLKPREA